MRVKKQFKKNTNANTAIRYLTSLVLWEDILREFISLTILVEKKISTLLRLTT